MLKVILFDLDETLYPRASALMHVIGKRIEHYVTEYVGIPPTEAEVCRRRWRNTYGTALRGMMEEGYTVDVDDYLRYVHDVPLDGVIYPQPEVRKMLLNLPLRRAVLTNSDAAHASRVLSYLNLLDCFERIIDLRTLNFVNKPDPRAYQRALDILGVKAGEVIFVEDTPVNTRPARDMGIHTILVDNIDTDAAEYHIKDILGVSDVVSELLRQSQVD